MNRLLIAVLCFTAGCLAAAAFARWADPGPIVPVEALQIESQTFPPVTDSSVAEDDLEEVRASDHPAFGSIVETFRRLAKFEGRSGKRNSIYVSDVRRGPDGDFAYAYWKEDSSVTILNLPLPTTFEKSSSEYWWLRTKARIDLPRDVVPIDDDIRGSSFLVDHSWVTDIKKRCLAGVRLSLR